MRAILKPRNLWKRYFGTPDRRRKAWHRHLEALAGDHKLHVYKSHIAWMLPGAFQAATDRWGVTPGIPIDRCFTLFSAAETLRHEGIKGDSIECGVRYGRGSHFILSGFAEPSRPHHLVDSFAGLSTPQPVDQVRQTGLANDWRAGDLAVTRAEVEHLLAGFGNCVYHPGWIPDSLAELTDTRFALAHIDVDLYEPTLASFRFLYDRMTPGGMMICDDYGLVSCPGARRAIDDFFADKPEKPLFLPTGQSLVIKFGASA
ncbi:TylF/MycF/NovP-related O-methyltransferase [Oceanibacterium hippocampi]|uniref:Macrocin O-methyltransferase n=1 Tax=Oceanibacterium hippocampi TaxID=745714 RepID=A0A1Y5RU55_9PROT|nr:TylF/MycF/NovP-related O-methyltransferase [Oceanibacterium hippocampi]SLN25442.1 Macrocin O-methyltransferase [Oceanibacterium hippocampi]